MERVEKALWKVTVPGSEATVRYKVRIEPFRIGSDAAKPFLTPTGGLFGDLHVLMYVLESPQTPAHVACSFHPGGKSQPR